MKGVCINDFNSSILKKGEIYYLFPCGKNAFYVSHFNRVTAHFGAFSKSRFEIVEERTKSSTTIQNSQKKQPSSFKPGERYKALLCKDRGIHKANTHYYLEVRKSGKFVWYYGDPRMTVCLGCCPIEYFKDFERHNPEDVPKEKITPQPEKCYKAFMWKEGMLKNTGVYFIKVRERGLYADFYLDEEMTEFVGVYPLGYFKNFELHTPNNIQSQQEVSFNVAEEHGELERQYEQLTIFDF